MKDFPRLHHFILIVKNRLEIPAGRPLRLSPKSPAQGPAHPVSAPQPEHHGIFSRRYPVFPSRERLCTVGGASPESGCVPAKGRCHGAAQGHCAQQDLFGFLQFLALYANKLWKAMDRRYRLRSQTAGRFGEEAVEVEEKFFMRPAAVIQLIVCYVALLYG
jgi:hypothetical protein